MNTAEDFGEYYRTIENKELVSIINNPEDYQPLALEAAKLELSQRSITVVEETEAKGIAEKLRSEKIRQQKKFQIAENKLKI